MNLQDPTLIKATQLALILHKLPSEILKNSTAESLELDYQLIAKEIHKQTEEGEKEEKINKMKEWYKKKGYTI